MKEKDIVLYHGSPNEILIPTYGMGEARHDYGKGFYLTEDINLAKEWAVCIPGNVSGWVHKYYLDGAGLSILDFEKENILSWLAELMKHRQADTSKRYRMLSARFIEKYAVSTQGYDVIKGWRANASYFYITKAFVRDEIDVDILEELLLLGGLGVQYCIKTEKAYGQLKAMPEGLVSVNYTEFSEKYNERDILAREKMKKLIDSERNQVTKVFSTLI